MENLLIDNETIGQKAKRLKMAVIANLGWSEEDYGNFQYEQGLIYLETYLASIDKVDSKWMDSLVKSRIFWNWWKCHWNIREGAYIVATKLKPIAKVELYKALHDGKMLASDMYPNKVILEDSYSYMMHELVAEETKLV